MSRAIPSGRATHEPSPDGLGHSVGVPIAAWALLDDYSYTPIELTRETKSAVFYKFYSRTGTEWVERKSMSALPWRGSEADARRLSDQLKSARAERDKRLSAARMWFNMRVAELMAASTSTPINIDLTGEER